jgi:hypothetical protein
MKAGWLCIIPMNATSAMAGKTDAYTTHLWKNTNRLYKWVPILSLTASPTLSEKLSFKK